MERTGLSLPDETPSDVICKPAVSSKSCQPSLDDFLIITKEDLDALKYTGRECKTTGSSKVTKGQPANKRKAPEPVVRRKLFKTSIAPQPSVSRNGRYRPSIAKKVNQPKTTKTTNCDDSLPLPLPGASFTLSSSSSNSCFKVPAKPSPKMPIVKPLIRVETPVSNNSSEDDYVALEKKCVDSPIRESTVLKNAAVSEQVNKEILKKQIKQLREDFTQFSSCFLQKISAIEECLENGIDEGKVFNKENQPTRQSPRLALKSSTNLRVLALTNSSKKQVHFELNSPELKKLDKVKHMYNETYKNLRGTGLTSTPKFTGRKLESKGDMTDALMTQCMMLQLTPKK